MSWLGPIPKQWWSSLRSREFPALYTGDMLSRAWPGQDVIASCAFAQLHLFLPLVPAMSFRVKFRFVHFISAVTMTFWLHGFFFSFFFHFENSSSIQCSLHVHIDYLSLLFPWQCPDQISETRLHSKFFWVWTRLSVPAGSCLIGSSFSGTLPSAQHED